MILWKFQTCWVMSRASIWHFRQLITPVLVFEIMVHKNSSALTIRPPTNRPCDNMDPHYLSTQQIVCCDNFPLWHSDTCTIRPGIFVHSGFEGDSLSQVTWCPPSSTCLSRNVAWPVHEWMDGQGTTILHFQASLLIFVGISHWMENRRYFMRSAAVLEEAELLCNVVSDTGTGRIIPPQAPRPCICPGTWNQSDCFK